MPVGNRGDGPARRVVDDDDRRARGETTVEESGVRRGQPLVLHPEVRHPADHELVLVPIVHVVQDDTRVPSHQRLRDALSPSAGQVGPLRIRPNGPS